MSELHKQITISAGNGLAKRPASILLVSSDRADSILVGHLLAQSKHRNYLLQRATDIPNALQAITNGSCDIVLMNYHWNQLRIGGTFIRKAKAIDPHMPVIIYTADIEADVEQQIVNLGAADYLCLSDLTAKLLDRSIRFSLQRKHKESQLQQLAHNDFLTGLPNRMLFQDRLRQCIRVAERERQQFAMVLIDVNGFKEVNDTFGHQAGDAVLQEFAARLQQATRKSDTVARLGGDEFALLFNKIGEQGLIAQLAHKLLQAIKPAIEIDGQQLDIACSIGIAVYPESGGDAEVLQRHADIAMYHAKKSYGSHFEFYSPEISLESRRSGQSNSDFLDALAKNQIGLYFNPRIETATGRIVGIEVNPYWDHPELGLLEYEQFHWRRLDDNLSSRFIEWLLATCLEYFKQLAISSDVKLVLNIEFQDLLNPGFARMVSAKLQRYDIRGKQIEFDLTNIRSDDYPASMLSLSLTDLERQGVTFGMNGFGVDHLPLLKLDDLPISVFKLDKRFSQGLEKGEAGKDVIAAQISFAHQLGKTIAVEGDHRSLPVDKIKSLGFDFYKSIFSVDMDSLAEMQQLLDQGSSPEVESLPEISA